MKGLGVSRYGKTVGVTAFFLAIAIYAYITNKEGDKYMAKVRTDSTITTGVVEYFGVVFKHGYTIKYYFTHDGQTYRSQQSDESYNDLPQVVGREFPVIYNEKAPEYSYMLIFQSDLKKVPIKLPASLSGLLRER